MNIINSHSYLGEPPLHEFRTDALNKLISKKSIPYLQKFMEQHHLYEIRVGSDMFKSMQLLALLGFKSIARHKVKQEDIKKNEYYNKEEYHLLFHPKLGLLELQFGDSKLSKAFLFFNTQLKSNFTESSFANAMNFTAMDVESYQDGTGSPYLTGCIKCGDILSSIGEVLNLSKPILPLRINNFSLSPELMPCDIYYSNHGSRHGEIGTYVKPRKDEFYSNLSSPYKEALYPAFKNYENNINWKDSRLSMFSKIVRSGYQNLSNDENKLKIPVKDKKFYTLLGKMIANDDVDIEKFLTEFKTHTSSIGHTFAHAYIMMGNEYRNKLKPHLSPEMITQSDCLGFNPVLLLCACHNDHIFFDKEATVLELFKEFSAFPNFKDSLKNKTWSFLDSMVSGQVNKEFSHQLVEILTEQRIEIPMTFIMKRNRFEYNQVIKEVFTDPLKIKEAVNKEVVSDFVDYVVSSNLFIQMKQNLAIKENKHNKLKI